MSLILRSPTAMTAPLPNTPRLPDVATGLHLRWQASSLPLEDGETVSNWLASGAAPSRDRALAKQPSGSGWSFPTYDADGGPHGSPAVIFSGAQRIANTIGDGTDVTAVPQPTTVAVVFRGTGGATARVVGGVAGSLHNLVPFASGATLGIGAGTTVNVAANTADWCIAIVAFDGSNSRYKINNNEIKTIDPGTNGYRGTVLGGFVTGNTNSGFVGGIADLIYYSRKFSDDDIDALYSLLSEQYGL